MIDGTKMRRAWVRVSALAALTICGTFVARADSCNGVSGNLVTNCGFEMGSLAGWTGTALTAGSNYAGVDTGDPFTSYTTPYAGSYEAYLGNPASTITLSQTLATTPGSPYQVEFALLNDTAPSTGYTNSFFATFGSGSYLLNAIADGPYTLYGFSAFATSNTTSLSFTSRNDGGFFELDSISVAQTPEPSTLTLLGSGVLGLAGVLRRKRVFGRSQ